MLLGSYVNREKVACLVREKACEEFNKILVLVTTAYAYATNKLSNTLCLCVCVCILHVPVLLYYSHRRMQSKRSKRQRQIRSNSVVSSASSSRSSMASPDIGSCTSENTQLPLTCYSVNGSNANTTMSSLSTSSSSNR